MIRNPGLHVGLGARVETKQNTITLILTHTEYKLPRMLATRFDALHLLDTTMCPEGTATGFVDAFCEFSLADESFIWAAILI